MALKEIIVNSLVFTYSIIVESVERQRVINAVKNVPRYQNLAMSTKFVCALLVLKRLQMKSKYLSPRNSSFYNFFIFYTKFGCD